MPQEPIEARLAHAGILAAALGVFERKGYGAARVEDILHAAGIARRTFYRQFKSKDDVLVALYGVAVGEILAAMRDVEDEDDPLRGVHRAIDVYLDYCTTNARTLRVVLGQAMQVDSPLAPMRRSFRAAVVRLLAEVARRKKKDLAPVVFVALLSALEGLSFELLEAGATAADVASARQTAHALLAKVLSAPGPTFPRAPARAR